MQRLLQWGLGLEIIIFGLLYYFGPHGLSHLSVMKIKKEEMLQEIMLIGAEVDQLKKDIKRSTTVFAKEKIARERLCMKKDNETVYFIK